MMLHVVATPIGNLQDITLRAVEVLAGAQKIYCEDTRRTRVLCAAHNIETPLESFHQHSTGKIDQIIGEIKAGLTIAYVTDAGTPGIQDPGGLLVERAHQEQIRVVPIPGPSSVTAILSVAGVPADSYWFAGYVPTKKGRQTFVKKLLSCDETVVFFETAPRLLKLFDQLIEFDGAQRTMIIGRELTKQFEEVRRATVAEHRDYYRSNPLKGELVLVLR
jgi:16S rRNA (cytidine1402-2'-O)-methyltransferase